MSTEKKIETTSFLQSLHPDVTMKKDKIFSKPEAPTRKTKIICTLG